MSQEPTRRETYYVQRDDVHNDYDQRSVDELRRDVNVAHDFTRKLVREKDRIEQRLETQTQLQRLVIKALTCVCSVEFVVIGWLVHILMHSLGR